MTTPTRAAPLSLAVTIVPDCERTPEWSALWRRLLRPLPTPDPEADDAREAARDAH